MKPIFLPALFFDFAIRRAALSLLIGPYWFLVSVFPSEIFFPFLVEWFSLLLLIESQARVDGPLPSFSASEQLSPFPFPFLFSRGFCPPSLLVSKEPHLVRLCSPEAPWVQSWLNPQYNQHSVLILVGKDLSRASRFHTKPLSRPLS